MAKVQVFLPEPPKEFNTDSFRQINLALETITKSIKYFISTRSKKRK